MELTGENVSPKPVRVSFLKETFMVAPHLNAETIRTLWALLPNESTPTA